MSSIEIHGDLIRGHIDTIILKALFDGDRYGYDIIKEIEQKSKGQYQLKQPTLYSSLKRLEEQGLTSSYWSDEKVFGGRKKYYTLTKLGKDVFLKNQQDWLLSRGIIDCLISDETTAEFAAMAHKNIAAYYDNDDAQAAAQKDNNDKEESPEISEQEIEDIFRKVNSDFEIAETEKPTPSSYKPDYRIYNQPPAQIDARPDAPGKSYAVYPTGYQPKNVQPAGRPASAHSFGRKIDDDYDTDNDADDDCIDDETDDDCIDDIGEVENDIQIKSEEKFEDNTFELDQFTNAPRKVVVDSQTSSTSGIDGVLADFTNSYGERSYVGDMASRIYTPSPVPKNTSSNVDDDEVPYEEYVKNYDDTIELPYQAAQADPPKSEPELRSENRFPQFLKYNSPNITPPPTDEDIIKRDYRGALDKLASSVKPTVKNQQQAKLEKLTENARQMGDEVIIRRHDDTIKVYNSENYYYKNRLRLLSNFIVYCIVLVEVLVMFALHYFVFSSFTLPNAIRNYITPIIYYLSIALGAFICLPFLAGIAAFNNLNARKLKNTDIKATVVFRSIVVALIWAIIFFVNFYWGILNNAFVDYIATLIMPALIVLNFLLSIFVHQILLKSGKFNVKN